MALSNIVSYKKHMSFHTFEINNDCWLCTFEINNMRWLKCIVSYFSLTWSCFTYLSIMVLNFGLFQLGGPLSLPWGLYVLICQVKSGANWCFRYTKAKSSFSITYQLICDFFLKTVENTRKTMFERHKWCGNLEEDSLDSFSVSCCFDSHSIVGWTCGEPRRRACDFVLRDIQLELGHDVTQFCIEV
jgi:hypothetical protein